MSEGPARATLTCEDGAEALQQIREHLETKWLARNLHIFELTDSTNRVALELGRDGAAHGTAVIAESQSAGRGRLGRRFFSPPGQNLYTSIVLRPARSPREAPTLVLAAAVAVAEAVAETLGRDDTVEIKWPNDVLLGGLKTSGILMELQTQPSRVDFAVLGIGVNLNLERERLPVEFRHLATSLRSHAGAPVDRTAFACRLFGILERVMDCHAQLGFAALRSRFEARFRMAGRRVRVLERGGPELRGIVRGIDGSGALQIEGEDGRLVPVVAGDVTLAKPEVGA